MTRQPQFGGSLSSTVRRGFTLVEMLVAVALVLLIMTMFAQIFQMAAGSISAQQGIAQTDQQARMITSLVRGDLDKRTMRVVLPFAADEDTRRPDSQIDQRRGYFYYAENNPADDTDDVLQFTAMVTLNQQETSSAPYSGRADSRFGVANLLGNASRQSITGMTANSLTVSGTLSTTLVDTGDFIWVTGSLGGANDGTYLVTGITGSTLNISPSLRNLSLTGTERGQVSFVNEPELDDAFTDNQQGSSIAAEISYFLREGTLYRRILPIREGASLEDAQPKLRGGKRAIWTDNPSVANGSFPSGEQNGNYPRDNQTISTFWRDFDYSAFHFPGKTTTGGTFGPALFFHAAGSSLYNGSDGEVLIVNEPAMGAPTTINVCLGVPNFRFGHNPNSGLPREYLNLNGSINDMSNDTTFIGRFLVQETASLNFGYPGYLPTNNPFSRTLTATSGLPHVIDEFEDSPAVRRGDDIVLANVLAFDIKAFDPVSRDSRPASAGYFDLGDNLNTVNEDTNNNGVLDTGEDANGNGILDVGLYRRNRVGNVAYSPVSEDANGNGTLDMGEDANGNGALDHGRYRYDTWHPKVDLNGDSTLDNPPFRPDHPPGSGNFQPLKAIQITIVYQSQVDGRIRQVTIVQSLQDVKP